MEMVKVLLGICAFLLFVIMLWLAAIFGRINGAIERHEARKD